MSADTAMQIGLISDTHGLLRPEALDALRGCELILHAGDIGSPRILQALSQLAPLRAVRGNNDSGDWAEALPECLHIEAGGKRILLLHDRKALPRAVTGVDLVASGHSHKPSVETRDGLMFVNPGSAGPRRFSLPVTLARLSIDDLALSARILRLL